MKFFHLGNELPGSATVETSSPELGSMGVSHQVPPAGFMLYLGNTYPERL